MTATIDQQRAAKIKFATRTAKATDKDSARYCLGNTFVTTKGDAIATDGRIMAIAHVDREGGDGPIVVPCTLGPATAKDCNSSYEANGAVTRTVAKTGTSTTQPPFEGRFPPSFGSVPEMDGETRAVVRINAGLLHKLAQALTAPGAEDDEIVTLLVAHSVKEAPSLPIGVVAGGNIGILMPIGDPEGQIADFNARRAELEYIDDEIKAWNDRPKD